MNTGIGMPPQAFDPNMVQDNILRNNCLQLAEVRSRFWHTHAYILKRAQGYYDWVKGGQRSSAEVVALASQNGAKQGDQTPGVFGSAPSLTLVPSPTQDPTGG